MSIAANGRHTVNMRRMIVSSPIFDRLLIAAAPSAH
jgi:hypothetical protein